MDIPEGMIPDEIRAKIEAGEVELVNGGEMTATDLLEFALKQVDPVTATQMLVTQVAALRASHVVHSDCDCTPDDAWENGFDMWEEIVREAKAQIKPMYDQYIEQHIFAVDVENGLADLEVAEPVRPGDEEL